MIDPSDDCIIEADPDRILHQKLLRAESLNEVQEERHKMKVTELLQRIEALKCKRCC